MPTKPQAESFVSLFIPKPLAGRSGARRRLASETKSQVLVVNVSYLVVQL